MLCLTISKYKIVSGLANNTGDIDTIVFFTNNNILFSILQLFAKNSYMQVHIKFKAYMHTCKICRNYIFILNINYCHDITECYLQVLIIATNRTK